MYLLVFQRRRPEHDGRHVFYFLDGTMTKTFCISGSGKLTGFFITFYSVCDRRLNVELSNAVNGDRGIGGIFSNVCVSNPTHVRATLVEWIMTIGDWLYELLRYSADHQLLILGPSSVRVGRLFFLTVLVTFIATDRCRALLPRSTRTDTFRPFEIWIYRRKNSHTRSIQLYSILTILLTVYWLYI